MIDIIDKSKNKLISLKTDSIKDLLLLDNFIVSGEVLKFLVHNTPECPNGSNYQKPFKLFGINTVNDEYSLLLELFEALGVSNNVFFCDHLTSSSGKIENITEHLNLKEPLLFFYVKNKHSTMPLAMFIQGLRDSLCHGNLYKCENLYVLLSCSFLDNKYIKFLLIIDDIYRLDLIIKLFQKK